MRIAVLVHRMGAYHRARFAALARLANVHVVEICSMDETYPWPLNEGGGGGFGSTTLFPTERHATRLDDLERRLTAALDQYRPDAIAVPGWAEPAGLLSLAYASRRGIGRVVMSDSQVIDAPRKLYTELAKRAVVAFADAGLVAGRSHADYLAQLGLPVSRISVGYDVVDNDYFANAADAFRDNPAGASEVNLDATSFISLARFVTKKNLQALVRAHAAYARASRDRGEVPWRLVLIGDGPERSAIEATIASVRGVVEVRPFVTYSELPALYASAGALVLPSVVEQWGLVVNEAMAAGCPVIASTRAGSAAELIVDGVTGLLTEPDELSIAAALERMVRIDRKALCAAARAKIADWGPSRFAEGMIAACAKACSMQRRTPMPVIFLHMIAQHINSKRK